MQTLIFASALSLLAVAGEVPTVPAGAVLGLEPGQTTTVRRDPDGPWQVAESGQAETPGPASATQVGQSDSVTFTFRSQPEIGGMMLVVRNRSAQAFTYEALIVKGQDRPQRTSVCVVSPGLVNYESWPYKFERIYFGNLKLVDPKSAPPDCK